MSVFTDYFSRYITAMKKSFTYFHCSRLMCYILSKNINAFIHEKIKSIMCHITVMSYIFGWVHLKVGRNTRNIRGNIPVRIEHQRIWSGGMYYKKMEFSSIFCWFFTIEFERVSYHATLCHSSYFCELSWCGCTRKWLKIFWVKVVYEIWIREES